MRTCSVEGCDRADKKLRKGMCSKHYQRDFKYGDPLFPVRPETIEGRFWVKVSKSEGCWNWIGAKSAGYGAFKRNKVQMPAHRFSYEMANGPIPEGLVLDHICRNRSCVRPDHLRAATPKLNMENLDPAGYTDSGVRGVCWYPQKGKWLGRVGHNGESVYVGMFDDFEDCRAAVIAKRLELHTFNDTDRRAAA